MHWRRTIWLLRSLLPLLVLLLALPALAQQDGEELELRLRRDFGYGSGPRVQGRFSMRVAEFGDVERVEFLIDGEVIGDDAEPPFALQFQTGTYPDGWHTLQAIGYRPNGETVVSNSIRREFVQASTANWTIFAVLGIAVAGLVLRYVMTRGDKASSYGIVGGTVCPHCDRPFAYHSELRPAGRATGSLPARPVDLPALAAGRPGGCGGQAARRKPAAHSS